MPILYFADSLKKNPPGLIKKVFYFPIFFGLISTYCFIWLSYVWESTGTPFNEFYSGISRIFLLLSIPLELVLGFGWLWHTNSKGDNREFLLRVAFLGIAPIFGVSLISIPIWCAALFFGGSNGSVNFSFLLFSCLNALFIGWFRSEIKTMANLSNG